MDGRRYLLIVLIAAWVGAFGYAFVLLATLPPTGDGFTRGLNRMTAFIGWHLIAGLMGFAAWGVGLAWPKGSGVRTVSRAPLLISLGLAATMGAMSLWAGYGV